MICEDEFIDESKVDSQRCHTCLSIGRNLSPLGPKTDILKKILPKSGYWNAFNTLEICWECSSFLLKILKFQNKVMQAAKILQLGQAYLNNTLSNLTSVIFNDSNVICISDAHTQILTETKSETIDSDIKDDTGHISEDFIPTIDIESVKVELKMEELKIKKVKNNKWAKKKALLNKKPKFKVIMDYKEIFRKVKMNSVELELCLERERDSMLFKSRNFKCESCLIGFKDGNALAGHNKRCHSQSLGTYICDICHTHTSTKRELAQHIARHYHKYECVLCTYFCYHKRHRLAHWNTHSKAFQCVKCELKFQSRREFFRHYKEWHEKFICHHCGVSFKMRYCIKDHIRSAHKYTCRHVSLAMTSHLEGICAPTDTVFYTSAHTRKQHSPFECKQCDKRFSRYNGLWLHNKVCHTTPSQGAYCVECDKRYVDVYRYRWHLSNSARHRPRTKLRIPCPGCDKVFTKKIYMKDHYDLVHLRKYKYRCEQCDKNFLRNADLSRHRRRVHEGLLPPRNKICYMCGRGFTTNKILSNHMRTHTGERPFACARCSAAFAQRAALAAHTRAKHHS